FRIEITECIEDKDCPYNEYCLNKKCIFSISCVQNKTRCVENHTNKKYLTNASCTANQDCLSNSCEKKICVGQLINCNFIGDKNNCGLPLYSSCNKDKECLSNYCNNNVCKN
ncbi:hypothetical protein BCR36DRAFT_255448, partial [Piromyces finnis]